MIYISLTDDEGLMVIDLINEWLEWHESEGTEYDNKLIGLAHNIRVAKSDQIARYMALRLAGHAPDACARRTYGDRGDLAKRWKPLLMPMMRKHRQPGYNADLEKAFDELERLFSSLDGTQSVPV